MQIVETFRHLITFESLSGLAMFSVQRGTSNLHIRSRSTPLQLIAIAISLCAFCIYAEVVRFPTFSIIESLVFTLRRSFVLMLPSVLFADSLINSKSHIRFWTQLGSIERVFASPLGTSIQFNRLRRAAHILIIVIGLGTLSLSIYLDMTTENKLWFVVFGSASVTLGALKSFYYGLYASLLVMHTRQLNRVAEKLLNDDDESPAPSEIQTKVSALRRAHYLLFHATRSFNDSTSFSIPLHLVYEFFNIFGYIYFTAISGYIENKLPSPFMAQVAFAQWSFFSLCSRNILADKLRAEVA